MRIVTDFLASASPHGLSRRTAFLVLPAAVAALTGCSGSGAGHEKLPPINIQATTLREGFSTMERLVTAARKENHLTVIGLSPDWVNFGAIVDRFTDKYGIEVKLAEPNAGSRRQIDAAEAAKPDAFNLSMDVAVANARRFAPYRVTAWNDLPDELKDQGGSWYGLYGGYMSIGYDPSRGAAPTSYADLLKPGRQVALPGDPLQNAAAFNGVMAASLRDGEPLAKRGVAFFAQLKKLGALTSPARASVLVDWDYRNLARGGNPAWKVTVPSGSALAGYYVQAISKHAPHPAAARLWQEFLYSDEAQNLLLRGHARPARLEALEMKGTVDAEAAAKLPKVTGAPVYLTIPQADAAKTYLRANWPRIAS